MSYAPCATHSVNLFDNTAAECLLPKVIAFFFSLVQKVYTSSQLAHMVGVFKKFSKEPVGFLERKVNVKEKNCANITFKEQAFC